MPLCFNLLTNFILARLLRRVSNCLAVRWSEFGEDGSITVNVDRAKLVDSPTCSMFVETANW